MSTTIDKTRAVPARPVEMFDGNGGCVTDALPDEPGYCQWFPEDRRLGFCCPGCGAWAAVRVGPPVPITRPVWDVTAGIPDDPTTLSLTPSILNGCCGWHGYLTDGVFRSC